MNLVRAGHCLALVASLSLLFGCVSLSMSEEAQWGELLNEDIVDEPIGKKNVWAAGILDFLIPGFGHFYLGEWGSGSGLFISNVFWPLSPFWATPAAVVDTEVVNKRYTVEYYFFGPGRTVIAEKEQEAVFQEAKEYIYFQHQSGRTDITRREVTDFLFLQDFKSEHIQALDWLDLERRTGAHLVEVPSESRDVSAPPTTPSEEPTGSD